MNRKAKEAAAIVANAFYQKRFMLRDIFVRANQEISHLEGKEFSDKWQEYQWPYQRECAELALDLAAKTSPEAEERVARIREDYSVAGLSEVPGANPSKYMYPDYVFVLVYYALSGKKAKQGPAEKVDAEVMQMRGTWIRKWDFDLQHYGEIKPDPGEDPE